MSTIDVDIVLAEYGSQTPQSITRSLSFSTHNSDNFNSTADVNIEVLSSPSHSIPPISQEDNTSIPDCAQNYCQCVCTTLTTNCDDHSPIENETIILLEPTPSSIVLTHVTTESAPSASTNCQPKKIIRPRLLVDQAEISNNDCANSNCDSSKRPGGML